MSIYHHSEEVHNLSSPRAIVPEMVKVVRPTSVLDVGCGIGTWLKAFEENGVTDYIGIDGAHVDRSLLKIPATKFLVQDLASPTSIGRKFDLVVCLEVAEHLNEHSAKDLVAFLTAHGDTIVFSAAIPGQGGQNHLNEQWPAFWQQIFSGYGYYFHDVLRKRFWMNKDIQWWYKQNIFLVNREPSHEPVLPLVHPELFQSIVAALQSYQDGRVGVRSASKVFVRALRRFFNR